MPRKRKELTPRELGIVHHPPPDDPGNIFHPSHREQWMELARALGRLDAHKDFEIIYGSPPPERKDAALQHFTPYLEPKPPKKKPRPALEQQVAQLDDADRRELEAMIAEKLARRKGRT